MSAPFKPHTATRWAVTAVASSAGTGEYDRASAGTVSGMLEYLTADETILVGLEGSVGARWTCDLASGIVAGDYLEVLGFKWDVIGPPRDHDHGLPIDHSEYILQRLN